MSVQTAYDEILELTGLTVETAEAKKIWTILEDLADDALDDGRRIEPSDTSSTDRATGFEPVDRGSIPRCRSKEEDA